MRKKAKSDAKQNQATAVAIASRHTVGTTEQRVAQSKTTAVRSGRLGRHRGVVSATPRGRLRIAGRLEEALNHSHGSHFGTLYQLAEIPDDS